MQEGRFLFLIENAIPLNVANETVAVNRVPLAEGVCPPELSLMTSLPDASHFNCVLKKLRSDR